MAYIICLWQGNNASLNMPTQDDLVFTNAVFFSQAFNDWMVEKWLAITGKRRPRHAYYLMFTH